jgi:hypothetical protein
VPVGAAGNGEVLAEVDGFDADLVLGDHHLELLPLAAHPAHPLQLACRRPPSQPVRAIPRGAGGYGGMANTGGLAREVQAVSVHETRPLLGLHHYPRLLRFSCIIIVIIITTITTIIIIVVIRRYQRCRRVCRPKWR